MSGIGPASQSARRLFRAGGIANAPVAPPFAEALAQKDLCPSTDASADPPSLARFAVKPWSLPWVRAPDHCHLSELPPFQIDQFALQSDHSHGGVLCGSLESQFS
jgi:hypothetical protein